MMTIAKKRAAALGVMLVMAAASGWAVRSAWADGIPDTDVLTYAGTLEDNAGVPLSGSKEIQVNVYADGTGPTAVCQSPLSLQNVVAGRFEVKMPADCVTAMKLNPNAHVEVVVGTQSLGRSRIGAVPFAIEAARAGEATGALKAQVDQIPSKANMSDLAGKANVSDLAGKASTSDLAGKANVSDLAGKANAADLVKIGPWTQYTAKFSTDGGANNAGSALSEMTTTYRRVGDSIEIRGKVVFVAAPPAGTNFNVSLPPGLSIDIPKLGKGLLGTGDMYRKSNGMIHSHSVNAWGTGVSFVAHGFTVGQVGSTYPWAFGNGDALGFSAVVPIAGWSTTAP